MQMHRGNHSLLAYRASVLFCSHISFGSPKYKTGSGLGFIPVRSLFCALLGQLSGILNDGTAGSL